MLNDDARARIEERLLRVERRNRLLSSALLSFVLLAACAALMGAANARRMVELTWDAAGKGAISATNLRGRVERQWPDRE